MDLSLLSLKRMKAHLVEDLAMYGKDEMVRKGVWPSAEAYGGWIFSFLCRRRHQ